MNNDSFLAMVAKLYYIDKVKQNEIARRFHITPMMVSRMLKEAEQRGIVSFNVKMPWPLDVQLAHKVAERYGLLECFAIDVPQENEIPDTLGAFLAEYFVQILPQNAIVGLSWGYTISRFVHALPYVQTNNCSLIQLTGAFSGQYPSVTPTQIINEVSKKLNSRIYVLNAPLYASTPEVCEQLVNDPANLHIHDMARHSDINIIGLSPFAQTATTFKSGVIGPKDFEELKEAQTAGDLAGTFLDASGAEIAWSKNKLYTGVPLSIIGKAKNVICIAGESTKAPLLRQVCKRHYFNTLITTRQTAALLL